MFYSRYFFSDIVLEKHYKSVIHRSICDYFFDALKKVAQPEDVSPVIATPHHFLFVFYHNSLYFIAVTIAESNLFKKNDLDLSFNLKSRFFIISYILHLVV